MHEKENNKLETPPEEKSSRFSAVLSGVLFISLAFLARLLFDPGGGPYNILPIFAGAFAILFVLPIIVFSFFWAIRYPRDVKEIFIPSSLVVLVMVGFYLKGGIERQAFGEKNPPIYEETVNLSNSTIYVSSNNKSDFLKKGGHSSYYVYPSSDGSYGPDYPSLLKFSVGQFYREGRLYTVGKEYGACSGIGPESCWMLPLHRIPTPDLNRLIVDRKIDEIGYRFYYFNDRIELLPVIDASSNFSYEKYNLRPVLLFNFENEDVRQFRIGDFGTSNGDAVDSTDHDYQWVMKNNKACLRSAGEIYLPRESKGRLTVSWRSGRDYSVLHKKIVEIPPYSKENKDRALSLIVDEDNIKVNWESVDDASRQSFHCFD